MGRIHDEAEPTGGSPIHGRNIGGRAFGGGLPPLPERRMEVKTAEKPEASEHTGFAEENWHFEIRGRMGKSPRAEREREDMGPDSGLPGIPPTTTDARPPRSDSRNHRIHWFFLH
ncbi:MAG: hypothetical protein HW380_3712 [Magnetococcales bacterium]|nr:hypothetical protein [Magnetococcales bacterium]HIJ85701.1 hypothetical protein [Magnetococcales bacterium]